MEQTLTLEEKLVKLQDEMRLYPVEGRNSLKSVLRYVQPLVSKYNLALVINDTVECKGARYYVKAVARLIDPNCDRVIATTGETEHVAGKSGGSTKRASEIARYQALTGMFALN